MNPLEIELDRLYGLATRSSGQRLLMLGLSAPADWQQLSRVWRGVQSDLDLPAPAIAVSGVDALQLWFSLASPIAPRIGQAFLEGLCRRYLAEVKAARLRLVGEIAGLPIALPAESGPDRWSAFVAPDLAAVFSDTPWLDVPPSIEGQAALLRALVPTPQPAFEAALHGLGGAEMRAAAHEPVARAAPAALESRDDGRQDTEAARFLRGVMIDETAPLALRIEAAKALLSQGR